MTPASGLAIIMVQQTSSMYPEFGGELAGILMAAVVILQFAGPVLAQTALRLSREAMEEVAR
jgi:hypothetical protein